MSACVLTIPCDAIEWGLALPTGDGGCVQTGAVLRGGRAVLQITLQWPTPEPDAAVLMHTIDGRHAGDHD